MGTGWGLEKRHYNTTSWINIYSPPDRAGKKEPLLALPPLVIISTLSGDTHHVSHSLDNHHHLITPALSFWLQLATGPCNKCYY